MNQAMNLILDSPAPNIFRAGVAQLALAVVLFALLLFTSGWRWLAILELGGYFMLSGGALVLYGSLRQDVPFRKLASTWLPINPLLLVIFLVLFGSGVGLAETGRDEAGIALMTVGYVSLGVKSALRVFDGVLGDSSRAR